MEEEKKKKKKKKALPVSIGGELLLHALDDGPVLKEQDGAGAGLEASHALGGWAELGLGNDGPEDLAGDVPELVVLGAKEDEQAVALAVEGRRDVEEGLLDDLLDASSGDGAEVLVQGVDAAAILDGSEESIRAAGGGDSSGSHCSGFGGGCEGWC